MAGKLRRVIITKQYIYDVAENEDYSEPQLPNTKQLPEPLIEGKVKTFHHHNIGIPIVDEENVVVNVPKHKHFTRPTQQCPHCGKITQGLQRHIQLKHTKAGIEWAKGAQKRMIAGRKKKL